MFHIIVPCVWSDWNTGVCSKTCGGGEMTKTRTRTVTEKYGGTCNGRPTFSEACNTNKCPGTIFSNCSRYYEICSSIEMDF